MRLLRANVIARGLHQSNFDRAPQYNLLYDAYIGANLKIITQIENWGREIFMDPLTNDEPYLDITCLIAGRKWNLANPMNVYEVVNQMNFKSVEQINAAIPLGIEVCDLLFRKYYSLIQPIILKPNKLGGNADLLVWLLNVYTQLPMGEERVGLLVKKVLDDSDLIGNDLNFKIFGKYLDDSRLFSKLTISREIYGK